MPEEFTVGWGPDGAGRLQDAGASYRPSVIMPPMLSSPVFFPHLNLRRARLTANQLLHVRTESGTVSVVFDVGEVRHCTLTGKAYEAVDSNFAAPDTCFGRHRTPLADITTLDSELKDRCLPMLGAGAADPKLWDSAVRTAGSFFKSNFAVWVGSQMGKS